MRNVHAFVASARIHCLRQSLSATGVQTLEPQVRSTPERGHIPFSDGRICNLEATPDILTLQAEAPDLEALERLQRVVMEHIKRFAFREDLGEVQWTPTN